MARKFLIRTGLAGALAVMLAPTASPANQLNITTSNPVRPQIHLNPSLHIDVGSRTVYDLNASEICRPDERLKRSKRERRCRQDR